MPNYLNQQTPICRFPHAETVISSMGKSILDNWRPTDNTRSRIIRATGVT